MKPTNITYGSAYLYIDEDGTESIYRTVGPLRFHPPMEEWPAMPALEASFRLEAFRRIAAAARDTRPLMTSASTAAIARGAA